MSLSSSPAGRWAAREVHIPGVEEFLDDEKGHTTGGNHFYITAAPASIDEAYRGRNDLERVDFLLAGTVQYEQPSGQETYDVVMVRYDVVSAGGTRCDPPCLTRVEYHMSFVRESHGRYKSVCQADSPGANLFMYLEGGVWHRIFSPRYPITASEREAAVIRALELDASRVSPDSQATIIPDLLSGRPIANTYRPPPATLPAPARSLANGTERIESIDHFLRGGHFDVANHFWIPDDPSLSQRGSVPAQHHFMTTEVKKYPATRNRPETYKLSVLHYIHIKQANQHQLVEATFEFFKTSAGGYQQKGPERKLFTYLREGKWRRVHSTSYPKTEYERDQAANIGKRLFDQKEEYATFRFNCEHFVTFCLTGKATSTQIDFARKKIRTVAGVALGVLSVGAAAIFPPALAVGSAVASIGVAMGAIELSTSGKQPTLK